MSVTLIYRDGRGSTFRSTYQAGALLAAVRCAGQVSRDVWASAEAREKLSLSFVMVIVVASQRGEGQR